MLNVILLYVASVIYVFSVDFAYESILQPHQRSRIDVIMGKINDPRGKGYNLNQSKIAIGSGKLFGKGYLQGTQTKYNFVPEQSTDFIFCTIGEEWGFLGSLVLISIYLILLLRIVNIAERQRSVFARIYAYGVASILFFHFFINIGMTIGIIPVIGIPLPFISYGGSSLWSFTILLFLLLRFDSARKGLSPY
jgi:rod shape determining protein RodA